MNDKIALSNLNFKNIKHIDEEGREYWCARELMKILGYKSWRYFNEVIEKSKIACNNSGINSLDHFVINNKMVKIGSGACRNQVDYTFTISYCTKCKSKTKSSSFSSNILCHSN